MVRFLKLALFCMLLVISPLVWSDQDQIMVHDATMDLAVWLLWAILVIQLVLSAIMLVHTIQMNRWLRVRHFLFDQQSAKKNDPKTGKNAAKKAAVKDQSQSSSSTASQTASADAYQQSNSVSYSTQQPVEDSPHQEAVGYAQINEKMADFERSKKRPKQAEPEIPQYEVNSESASFDQYEPQSNYNTQTQNQDSAPPSDDADASRLDLAKAYIEMGEHARAKKLLNKVLNNSSNPANQAEAQYWLDIVADKTDQ